MRKREINSALKKYIQPELNSYFVHQDLMYKVDYEFLLKGYYFDSMNFDPFMMRVYYFIQPLFLKTDFIFLTIGDLLNRKERINFFRTEKEFLWDISIEKREESFKSILNCILKNGERNLNKIITLRDFYEKFHSERKEHISIYESVAYSTVFFASENRQNSMLRRFIKFCDSQMEGEFDEVEIQKKENASFLLSAKTTEQRLKILKKWANETIRNLKLPDLKYID